MIWIGALQIEWGSPRQLPSDITQWQVITHGALFLTREVERPSDILAAFLALLLPTLKPRLAPSYSDTTLP